MKKHSQQNKKSSKGRNVKKEPWQPQRKLSSPQTSSSTSTSSLRPFPSSIQHNAQRKPTKLQTFFHVRSSHMICYAVCVLSSVMVPIYVFDSPYEFLGVVKTVLFPQYVLKSNSSNSTKITSEKNGGEDFETGGWRLPEPEVLEKYDTNVCDIERISVADLTPEIFESHVRYKKPVLVTFPNGAADWTDPGKWTKSSLVQEYGERKMVTGLSLDIISHGGHGSYESSLFEFINNVMSKVTSTEDNRLYLFDRNFFFNSQLATSLKLPKYFSNDNSTDNSIFIMGDSLSGVVFHMHSDAWNGVVYGRKRWFLYPPTDTVPGGVPCGLTILEWLSRVYPNLTESEKPIECVQEPGEILYLPEEINHATINLGETVGFSINKKREISKIGSLSQTALGLHYQMQVLSDNCVDEDMYKKFVNVLTELNMLLPENNHIIFNLGTTMLVKKKFTDAMAWYQTAIKKDPYFVMAYIFLGKMQMELREYEESQASFKKAAELSPDLKLIYIEYGQLLKIWGLRRCKDVLPLLKKGTQLMPSYFHFWIHYYKCQIKLGDTDGAMVTEQIMNAKAKHYSERHLNTHS